jgi:hypothetical protein
VKLLYFMLVFGASIWTVVALVLAIGMYGIGGASAFRDAYFWTILLSPILAIFLCFLVHRWRGKREA